MRDIRNKTAFITGGAGGIGLAIARALAAEGAKIMLADIDGVEAERAAAALRADGATAAALALDVADPVAWPDARQQAEHTLGPVRILCNNAGVAAPFGPMEEINVAQWRWQFGINLDAHLFAVQTFLPAMRASGEEAHIVNTISMAGVMATAMAGAYTASKFAAMGLSASLNQELRDTKIGVSVLCPGYAATRLAQTSRQHQPDLTPPGELDAAFSAALRQAMPPEHVAARVVAAIKAREFYIFTHPAYRQVLEKIAARQSEAFNFQADPRFDDDVSALLPLF